MTGNSSKRFLNHNNCYGCPKRHEGCHSKCETYAAMRAEYDKIRERERIDSLVRWHPFGIPTCKQYIARRSNYESD